MQNTLRYCPECFTKLQSWGELPTSVFEYICEFYATQEGSLTIAQDSCFFEADAFLQIVDFLEKRRYVVSTETLDNIHLAIRPIDFEWDGETWFFCVNFKKHYFYKH